MNEDLVDTFGTSSYSLLLGIPLDVATGLNLEGVVGSRAYATGMNMFTGALYGKWRNLMFKLTKTTDKSRHVRKYLTDLLAFNTFQVPIYASAVALANFITEGEFDVEKIEKGALYLATFSPFIAPTMGFYMDKFRKLFGKKSAPEKSGENIGGKNEGNK